MLFKTYFYYPCCFETRQTYRFNHHSTYSYSGIASIERALNGKRIWQGIKQIVHINPQVNQSVSKIALENCEMTDPKSIADVFKNYFANIGSNLASSIPTATKTCFCPQLLQMKSN